MTKRSRYRAKLAARSALAGALVEAMSREGWRPQRRSVELWSGDKAYVEQPTKRRK